MFLASLARAIVNDPDLVAARKARAEARRLQQEQRERFKAEQREKHALKPDTRMIAFHARIDGLGLAPGLAEAFKSLSGNEQRLFANAAGDALAAAIPVYLAIAPERRRDGLAFVSAAKHGSFLERLEAFLRQSRRTLADDDADLL